MRELRKQDRTSSRLPTDTERKYKLGQIELTAEEVEQLKSKLVVDEFLSATSSNAIANKAVTNALNNKVTKENGKGLSTNDFTDEYKNKIDNWNGETEEGTTVELIGVSGTPTASNTYHANAINELTRGKYSTTEKVIGTWMDDKPLYRRCFRGTTSSSSPTIVTYDINSKNCSVKNSGGFLTEGTDPNLHMNIGGYVNDNWRCGVYINDKQLSIYHTSNLCNGAYEMFVEYTKTTD